MTRSLEILFQGGDDGPGQELASGEAVAGDAFVRRHFDENDAPRDDVFLEQRQRHLDVVRRGFDIDDLHFLFLPHFPNRADLQPSV